MATKLGPHPSWWARWTGSLGRRRHCLTQVARIFFGESHTANASHHDGRTRWRIPTDLALFSETPAKTNPQWLPGLVREITMCSWYPFCYMVLAHQDVMVEDTGVDMKIGNCSAMSLLLHECEENFFVLKVIVNKLVTVLLMMEEHT
jgi:hypothetical protein